MKENRNQKNIFFTVSLNDTFNTFLLSVTFTLDICDCL